MSRLTLAFRGPDGFSEYTGEPEENGGVPLPPPLGEATAVGKSAGRVGAPVSVTVMRRSAGAPLMRTRSEAAGLPEVRPGFGDRSVSSFEQAETMARAAM